VGGQTQQKPCRMSSDIGAEQENHTVGRGSTYDRKGLTGVTEVEHKIRENVRMTYT
jgi:hypothetical protein